MFQNIYLSVHLNYDLSLDNFVYRPLYVFQINTFMPLFDYFVLYSCLTKPRIPIFANKVFLSIFFNYSGSSPKQHKHFMFW